MMFQALELELVALKRKIIGKVLARRGLRLTESGVRAVTLGGSFDAFRPEVIPQSFVQPLQPEPHNGFFRRLVNWLRRWV